MPHPLVLFVLAILQLLPGPATSSLLAGSLHRSLDLHKGQLVTTRAAISGGSWPQPDSPRHVYVLGFPRASQALVFSQVEAAGGHVLQPLSEDHVLVTAPSIVQLLLNNSQLTVAHLPPRLKVSQATDSNLRQLELTGTLPDAVVHAPAKSGAPQLLQLSADVVAAAGARCSADAVVRELAAATGIDTLSVSHHTAAPAIETITFHVEVDKARLTVEWLAAHSCVLYVSVQLRASPCNLAASLVIQTGAFTPRAAPDPRRFAAGFPLWAGGLDGTGVTVGVMDTGLDMDSPFFWDDSPLHARYAAGPQLHGSLAGDPSYNFSFYCNPDARKVTHYFQLDPGALGRPFRSWADIDASGHGTHVAGTIAGMRPGYGTTKPDYVTGVAPEAKIAVWSVNLDGQGPVEVPLSYVPEVWRTFADQGIRVITNSWGANWFQQQGVTQPPSCHEIDQFLWDNQDVLAVAAAGNGAGFKDAWSTTGTVAFPALCKNTLAVGATWNMMAPLPTTSTADFVDLDVPKLSFPISLGVYTVQKDSLLFVVRNMMAAVNVAQVGVVGASWPNTGRFKPGAMYAVKLVDDTGTGRTACALPAKSLPANTVVLFFSGACPGTDAASSNALKISSVMAAGASGGIELFDAPDIPAIPTTTSSVLPFTTVSAGGVYRTLANYLADPQTYKVFVLVQTLSDTLSRAYEYGSTTHFSGFGAQPGLNPSAQDLRFKPDLVAPGSWLLSAYSGHMFQGVKDRPKAHYAQGTSSSAAVAAGAAALVLQYFQSGYYPSGSPNPADKFNPSAPLIKAVMLSSTTALDGLKMQTGEAFTKPPPDAFQGFGRLDLSRVLPLKASTTKLLVMDRVPLARGANVSLTLIATGPQGSGSLVVTLVWADYPSSGLAAPHLVNDLDLTVDAGLGTTCRGNTGLSATSDTTNIVEKVVIDKPLVGSKYVITVRASANMYTSTQRFALVVLGPIIVDSKQLKKYVIVGA